MMFNAGPLSDTEEQWNTSCNNIFLNFSVDTRMKMSICSFLHAIFISVKEEGEDDRRL